MNYVTLRSILTGILIGTFVMVTYDFAHKKWIYSRDLKASLSCPNGTPLRFDPVYGTLPFGEVNETGGSKMKLLFFGDPFLWGGNCPQPDSLPYLAARKLEANLLKSSMTAYNLPQFLLRAKEVVEKEKPDFIIVQYSPWLVERSMKPILGYAANEFQVPYFYGTSDFQTPVVIL